MEDPDEGFLYFPWQMHCNPDNSRIEAEQIELARYLRG